VTVRTSAARLKRGVSLQQAQADIDVIASRIREKDRREAKQVALANPPSWYAAPMANRQRAAPSEVDLLIDQYAAETRKLISAARCTLLSGFPGCVETVDSKARLLGYSYGPGYKGTVATLILSKTGVKIGVPFGASLKDPKHLLAGEGKVHRHVAVADPADLNAPALKALLRRALSAWKKRGGVEVSSRRGDAGSLARVTK
jgi:hypothetical protein